MQSSAALSRLSQLSTSYTAVPGEQFNTWRMADAQYMPNLDMVNPAWTRRAGGLSRSQMELVAARVTKLRECFY